MTGSARAQLNERIVADPATGMGLHGFDPVAYFVDGAALLGKPDFELTHAGVGWRFRNEGNRNAFARAPNVYIPAFGGYDPIAVAAGLPTPGHPEIWLMVGGRVLLFHSAANRDRLRLDPSLMAAAEERWPQVRARLAR